MCITVQIGERGTFTDAQIGERGTFTDVQIGERGKQRAKQHAQNCQSL